MTELWLYDGLSRLRRIDYRTKIMTVAFCGTHVPLICLLAFVCLKVSPGWGVLLSTLAVALGATLAGTGVTLYLLNLLLQPVLLTARTLRTYRTTRDLGALPTHYEDEAGILMADAAATLSHLERTLEALEFVDSTTGLPNRRQLERDIALRSVQDSTLLVCAIQFGGYRVLAKIVDLSAAESAAAGLAQRLRTHFKNEGLYRVSEDSFVALRSDAARALVQASGLAARLQEDLEPCRAMLTVEGIDVDPALLVGVSVCPADGRAAPQLIDQALGAAVMASVEAPVSFHSPEARRIGFARLHLDQDIRHAIDRDEFVLHYQPVIDLERGCVSGAEALVRWNHPQQGLLPPSRFIAAAEASGLIVPLGLSVMRSACRQIRTWNDSGLKDMKVAVNLSARQFLDASLTRFVDEALGEFGVSPLQLEIELTETAAAHDEAYTRAAFGRLRDLGVTIAIDDFGAGYASMSQLRRLPFDKLKIDREFIAAVPDRRDSQAICEALLALGQGLGLSVMAEGTETEDEVMFLKSRGCDLFQGFYFGRPLPPEDLVMAMPRLTQSALALKSRTVLNGASVLH